MNPNLTTTVQERIDKAAADMKKEINDLIEEYGCATIERRNQNFVYAVLEILKKDFIIDDLDLTGSPCFNEETGKTFYMRKDQGELYEFTRRKRQ